MPPKRKAPPAGNKPHEKRPKKEHNAAPIPTPPPPNPDATGPLYDPLPASLLASSQSTTDPDPIPATTTPGTFTQTLISHILPPTTNPTRTYTSKLHNKTLVVANNPAPDALRTARKDRLALQKARRKTKCMTSKEKKATGWFSLKSSSDKAYTFESFLPLHALWTSYMTELLGTETAPQNVLPRLLRADYHGAVFTVVKAKCPSLVGLCGVVVKETENMFTLVGRGGGVKVIPKRNTVFTFTTTPAMTISSRTTAEKTTAMEKVTAAKIYTLYGNQFRTRPGERAAKKFKDKASVDLP
ncbi:RNase P subunit p29-like protein [Fimicolochytrium jonesii]|uniref:RNase P subunit p29-like protein n=1 Tax=Fimicolochytrium jonesii TaxID=1396493 RepID=UPI0022FDBC96|nr:RNase P subunit p29-like protein [Fimicolochytrium jonesii]KAI8820123.1 RNase P subunit p29-like protein [Fimicolochytrium jonesii]